MSDTLLDSAPGFDQPIAVLKHCHERIRKQLSTLLRLAEHLPAKGADEEARKAAQAVIKYFDKAAHLHHEDEEQNLIPMLIACAQGEDAALLAQLTPGLLSDHSSMDAMWQDLHEQLKGVVDGQASLSAALAERFATAYTEHMHIEENHIAPMAKRLFTPEQMRSLGEAMQLRRGITVAPTAGDALADLRRDYGQRSLSESEVAQDPMAQFGQWFEEALKAEVNEPNAMSVATVDERGRPSSRIVLIKQYDQRGFTWYTNYDSQKGQQLRANPHAALLFFWSELERQVRIEGTVEHTSAEESDKYFHSRPLKSRLAAVASQQSAPIADRAAMEAAFESVAARYGEQPPRPAHWGGFRLVPRRIEFWQGRRSRFHDRIVYTLQDDGSWARERLQP